MDRPARDAVRVGRGVEVRELVGGARWGAVTHPGAKGERHVYMDQ
jgi:dihydroxy-acid dehydratase